MDDTLFPDRLTAHMPAAAGSMPAAAAAPAMPVDPGVSLSNLLARVKSAVSDAFPHKLWVRFEIAQVNLRNGHAYIDAVERNDEALLVASARCVIWKSNATALRTRFAAAAGRELAAGMRVLASVKPEFSAAYGLSLVITDIDASYTVGEMELRIRHIREKMLAEECVDKNRRLPEPVDFFRVAVISPSAAAGLGDFDAEARRLADAGICSFVYYDQATFQGAAAETSIRNEMARAYRDHLTEPYDALVIIRGGGATSDLQWLNCEKLARAVCNFPAPVITGIGHEKDHCILDEYAKIRTGTPSKAIQFIINRIVTRALDAERAWVETTHLAGRSLAAAESAAQAKKQEIRSGIDRQLMKATHHTDHLHANVQSAAITCLDHAQYRAAEMHAAICANARGALNIAEREVEHAMQSIRLDVDNTLHQAAYDIERDFTDIRMYAGRQLRQAEIAAQDLILGILAHGIEPTLRRGFALVRDGEGKPLSSRQAAAQQDALQLQFHDGVLRVTKQE